MKEIILASLGAKPRNFEKGFCMSLKVFLKNIYFLLRCYAPCPVLIKFFYNYVIARKKVKSVYSSKLEEYKNQFKLGAFTNDWFSGNIPHWLAIFDRYDFQNKKIEALEIGSWEGMSSLFMLTEMPLANLTCVDTWAGSDEHQGADVLNAIEVNFEKNLSTVSDRLKKYKGTSYSYFDVCAHDQMFDLIFIDGSHYSDDVLVDAVKAFQHLKINGVMIFDDYFWRIYRRDFDNPCAAINNFLRLKSGLYRVISVYGQIAIEKIGNERQVEKLS